MIYLRYKLIWLISWLVDLKTQGLLAKAEPTVAAYIDFVPVC